MARRSVPAERLRAWVKETVARQAPGTLLPSDRQLAHRFAVSTATAARLMREVASAGLVTRVMGRGTLTGSGEPMRVSADVRDGARGGREGLVRALMASIGSGELQVGDTIPDYKTLRLGFGLSPNTIRGALAHMVSQGHICRVGKSYRVGGFGGIIQQPSHREVVFLSTPRLDIAWSFTTGEYALCLN